MKLASIAAVTLLLVACRGARAPSASREDRTVTRDHRPGVSVVDFGAKGDGVTDDRAAIQAALEAVKPGVVLEFPAGTYLISASPRGAFGLEIHRQVHLRGAGQDKTVLRQAPGVDSSVRLIHVAGDGVVIEDLTLDGNKAKQSPNEHRHGLFITEARGLAVQRVTSRNFTGDGFYLYHGAEGARFTHVLATGNSRNGLTLGGMVDGTTIAESKFIANAAQQVDSEPGGDNVVSNTTLTRSVLDPGGVSTDYVLTCSGTGIAKGRDWTVTHNTLNGPVFVVWAERVVIADNTGVNASPKSFITVERSSSDVIIRANKLKQVQRTAQSQAGVYIVGTAGSGPERVRVDGHDIETSPERGFGVRATGAVSIEVVGNVLRGPGRAAPGYAGVYVRATVPERDFRSAVIRGNTIRNFGDRGVSVVGNGAARLLSVEVRDNTFADDSPRPTMTTGISLDDGTGAVQSAEVSGNRYLGGVRARVINVPRGAIIPANERTDD